MSNVAVLRPNKSKALNIVNRKVPVRLSNREYRTREYLSPSEMEKLIQAAGATGRYGHRDSTLLMLMYRHGLRVSELVALRWESIDLKEGRMHVSRLKNGVDSVHPLRGPELRALRKLKREYLDGAYLFMSERLAPLGTDAVRKIIQRAAKEAKLGFSVHPHMLRHACGYKLANDGEDTRAIQLYLGHRNIQHTVRYTELAPTRFKTFFRD